MNKHAAFMLCLMLLSCLAGFAQNIDYIQFHFDEKAPVPSLNDEAKKEPAVLIKDKRAVEYIYNDKGELELYTFRYKAIALLEDRAIEMYNKIYVQAFDREQIIKLRVRNTSPSGKVITLGEAEMKETTEEGRTYFILAIEGLEKNSVLEYFYILQSGVNYWGSEKLQTGNYVQKSELEIISPGNLFFKAKSYNGYGACVESTENEKNYLKANAENIPSTYEEQFSPGDAAYMRVEYSMHRNSAREGSSMFDFKKAATFFFDQLHPEKKLSEKMLKKIVANIEIKNASEEQMILAIENHVKAMYQIIDNSPGSTLEEIVKNKYGTQIEINQLYVALFEYLDIPFEIGITCNRFTSKFDKELDAWNFMDEIIFYFPGSKGYLSTNNITLRFPMVQQHYINQQALFIASIGIGEVHKAVHSVRIIEAPAANKSMDNLDLKISFSSDMEAATIDYSRQLTGYNAAGIRPFYFVTAEDKRDELIEQIIKEKSDNSKIEKLQISNFDMTTDDVQKPFIMKCIFTNPNLLEAAGDKYLFKVGETIGSQTEMYSERPRVTDIENDFNRSYLRKIQVDIPPGYTVSGLDKLKMNVVMPKDKATGTGFESDYVLDGNTLNITVNEYYNDLVLPKSEYEQFVKVINAAADFNKITLVIQKK